MKELLERLPPGLGLKDYLEWAKERLEDRIEVEKEVSVTWGE